MNVTQSIQLVVREIVCNTARIDNYVAMEISILHLHEFYLVNTTVCKGKSAEHSTY